MGFIPRLNNAMVIGLKRMIADQTGYQPSDEDIRTVAVCIAVVNPQIRIMGLVDELFEYYSYVGRINRIKEGKIIELPIRVEKERVIS